MKYYINTNKEIFAYDYTQINLLTDDLIEITLEEVQSINKAKEDEYKDTLEYKINEAKAYLSSTDYKMTIDYFATLTKELQDELILLRAEARQFIRENEL